MIVDDGIATGATAKAACQVARAQGARRVVLAVPIGGTDIVEDLSDYADEVVCLNTSTLLRGVGRGYRNFAQTSDEEVIGLLDHARDRYQCPPPTARCIGCPAVRKSWCPPGRSPWWGT